MAELRVKGTGTIKLFENDNTSSVTIASPASLGGDRTITLPDASVTLASGTMLATDGSGASLTALNASELGSGTVPDARFPATLPAASGANLTSLTATNLGSGTVPTARLGSGTASSSTVLYGDQTYKAEPGGGKILQVVQNTSDTSTAIAGTGTDPIALTDLNVVITPSATSSKIYITFQCGGMHGPGTHGAMGLTMHRSISGGADTEIVDQVRYGYMALSDDSSQPYPIAMHYLDSPSTVSEITYYWMYQGRSATCALTFNYGGGATSGRFIAMEIGA